MRAPLLLILLALAGAATAAPDEADRARVAGILKQFDALPAIDIGNCDYEHKEFSSAYRELTESPIALALQRVLAHYQLKPAAQAEVDHNPSKERCLATLEQAKTLFATHGDYLQKLAGQLPPADKAE
jgi:hypothetical protein